MLRHIAASLVLPLAASVALAATNTPVAPKAEATHAATTTQSTQLPLNKYGAIDVNAKVPYHMQVPAVPTDFKAPNIKPLANTWASSLPAAPGLKVKSYILVSANSGQIIAAYNANHREAPASLTKLMLLYITEQQLAEGNLHLSDQMTVPTIAWATGGSRMFLKPKEQVELSKLIEGTIVASGNDAAVTIATDIAGTQSAFVNMMNHQAHLLGMTNTHYNDVMGLPVPDHYSSAYDMSQLAEAIVTQYPQYLKWFGHKYFSFNGIRQANFNKLLFIDADALGLKTGSTNAAGYSLVSAAKQPNNPMMLVGVVMGATGPMASATASKALLNYGFRFFKDRELYAANKVIKKVAINGGAATTVPVVLKHDLWVTTPRPMASRVKAELQIQDNLSAPIKQGQQVGSIVVTLGRHTLKTEPVYTTETVKKGGFWDSVKHIL